jgi:hypothetical protein
MRVDVQAAVRATDAVASIPRDRDGPVFRAPWEAQAFAMAVTLHERGVFTWQEWAAPSLARSGARKRRVMPILARPITSIGWQRWKRS